MKNPRKIKYVISDTFHTSAFTTTQDRELFSCFLHWQHQFLCLTLGLTLS